MQGTLADTLAMVVVTLGSCLAAPEPLILLAVLFYGDGTCMCQQLSTLYARLPIKDYTCVCVSN